MPSVPPPDPAADGPLRLDLATIRSAIRAGKATPAWLASWLPSTYERPERFRELLYGFAGVKTTPTGPVDFYSDCVLAHAGGPKIAVLAREGRERVHLSYASLHARCSALAETWTEAGVEPGDVVAIVLGPGLGLAVAIVTALKLGLVLSILPPHGPSWVRTRLALLAPDHVAADQHGAKIAGLAETAVLPLSAKKLVVPGAVHHRYARAEVAARLFSPLIDAGATPFDVPAGVLHGAIVRDAMIAYALDGADVVAAPGFGAMQHEPGLLLTTLLAGAAWASVDDAELDASPRLFEELGVTVLGIAPQLRDRILAAPARLALPSKRAWFRSLSDTLDEARWDELAQLLTAQKLLGFHVHASSAAGGVQLFSAPAAGVTMLRVWPAAGETWQLSEISGGAVRALGASGVYTVLRDEEPDPAMLRVVLAEAGDGYLFVGPVEPMPRGLSYPSDEVAHVVERHESVRAAAAILAPGRWLNDARTVLLVFVDDPAPDAQPPVHELRELIEQELGAGLAPERIEVFPLRPRYIDGVVDRGWCRSEYLGGGLNRRARSELFVALSRLGWIFGAPRELP